MTSMRDRIVVAVTLAALLALAIALPYMVNRFIVNVLTLSITFALLALSVNLIAYAGLASLGHGGIMAVAAYALAFMAVNTDASLLTQAIVGILFGTLAGAAFGVLTMRTSGVYFIMATVALGMVVWGLTIRLTSITGGENGLRGVVRPSFLEEYWALYWFGLLVLVVSLAAIWVITRSPFGLALKGIQHGESRMRMLGYSSTRFKILAFTLSGVFAGLSGVMYAYYNRFVSPTAAGFLTSGKAVLMVILGGIGTLAGPVIGAIIITFMENVLNFYNSHWPTALGLLYIVAVLFARDGIVGLISRIYSRVVGRSPPPAGGPDPSPVESAAAEPSESARGQP